MSERQKGDGADFPVLGLRKWRGGRPVLWIRVGAVAGAVGYGISATFSHLAGIPPIADCNLEALTALVCAGAFFVARGRPALASAMILGAVTVELLLAVYLVPEAALVSPIVFPLLITISGLIVGPRAAIVATTGAVVLYPAALAASGHHGAWLAGLSTWSGKRLLVTEMVAVIAGVFAWLAIGTFSRLLAEAEERRRLEVRLQHLQRLEVVGQLAAIAAHDFQNVLAVVQNASHLLAGSADPQARGLGADLQQTSKGGQAITARLLALARREEPQRALIDVARTVEGLRTLATRLLGPRQTLALAAAGPAAAIADPVQVEQVLLNLVANARDSMPRGGAVSVRVAVVAGAEATGLGSTIDAARQVLLEVRDQGGGVPSEVRERVFEPFVTTKARGEGTGLGLATVRSIAVGSGGCVAFHSAPGEGAAFRVFLPEAAVSAEAAPVSAR